MEVEGQHNKDGGKDSNTTTAMTMTAVDMIIATTEQVPKREGKKEKGRTIKEGFLSPE